MNAKRITEIARGLAGFRGGAIYTLLAYATLALALYSCSEPPVQRQPATQPPTPAIAAATPVPATHMPQPLSAPPQTTPNPTLTSTPTLITPTPQSPIEPTPTPTAIPAFVPLPDNATFTQITAGRYHACGLKADGTPLCWGNNISGSLKIPGGNPTLSRISAGKNFTCGLRYDGAIACWGENAEGQASPPNGRFDEIAAGATHACALDEGTLVCWGEHFPDGSETIQGVPQLESLKAGGGYTCGLTPDANMACWDNRDGELATISGPFTSLGIGLRHACAIRVDGSVFCDDEHHDRTFRRSQPPPTKFAQIAAGWRHTCGITEASDIECWGSGVRGAPGERLRAPEGEFAAISIGWRHTCALRPNGYVTCWQQPDAEPLYLREPDSPASSDQLSSTVLLSEAFGGIEFEQPVELFPLPDGKLAVVERKGLISSYSAEPNVSPRQTMLDLTDKTECCNGESGMFSAALDPQFEEFPFLYVYYRVVSEHAYGENMRGIVGRLARFRVAGGKAVRDSELTILEMPQPGIWHLGGAIRFGADEMLYLGIGDSSQHEKAQFLDTLFGKIIRLDVRGATPESPYRAPPDNPFVNNPDARPEIWVYGLRNPWRMDFASDGRLFIADVGLSKQEEISLAAAGSNLGWPLCEGNLCQEVEGTEADADGRTAPIYAYGRESGCAVIGGVTAAWLGNGFVFGDLCSGRVWLLEQDGREGWRARRLAQTETQILSFGIDAAGTVYILIADKPIMRMRLDGEEWPHPQQALGD